MIPTGLVSRMLVRLRRESSGLAAKLRATVLGTYIPVDPGNSTRKPLRDILRSTGLFIPGGHWSDLLHRQSADLLAHRFNLLGSGPVIPAHGVQCIGVEGHRYGPHAEVTADQPGGWLVGRLNRRNLRESRRIWSLVDDTYRPIDWQLDFKSGYRWREDCWHRDIRIYQLPGVDVKVPWELARLQHLPTLALACHLEGAGSASSQCFAREIRNQALDFIACNPPGFGVNWVCPMDVGIRAANLLLARDIALAAGAAFDDDFEATLGASMVAHGRFIAANLEWSPRYRGNHYLANIAGLAFIAAYLPGNSEVDAWLAFAVQELIAEIGYQFHEDGSNFEASVCYHRLSAEIVLWTSALIAGLPAEKRAALQRVQAHRSVPRLRAEALPLHALPWGNGESPLPPWCWQRLTRMAEFTRAMTRPDGLVVQFGDNDSGRFVIAGSGEQIRAGNDPQAPAWSLDHGALVGGITALVGVTEPTDLATHVLCTLAGHRCAARPGDLPSEVLHREVYVPADPPAGEQAWEAACARRDVAGSRRTCEFPLPEGAAGPSGGVRLAAYPGMGCYVARNRRFYLAIRCGEIGLAGLGAHAHCDQLAIELTIDGQDMVRDPGTYLYTAAPTLRNAYRAAAAHHVPRVDGREPANLDRHPFDLRDLAPGECLYFGTHGFVGRHAGYGPYVYRMIALTADAIVVDDFADHGLVLSNPTPWPLPFSPGYGRRLAV